MQLTNSQQVAYDALLRGENVFLTGGAGTGKTTLDNRMV
jgi:MoxR-like ATPase